jgi:hypothetical protein
LILYDETGAMNRVLQRFGKLFAAFSIQGIAAGADANKRETNKKIHYSQFVSEVGTEMSVNGNRHYDHDPKRLRSA